MHRCILQGKSAQVWIQYCSICTNRALSNFFSVALKSDDEQDAGSSLKNINKKTLWVILMTGGGHFVGSIFQGWDKGFLVHKNQKTFWYSITFSLFYRKEVLQHKTFHRYTVRAKRGIAQGLRDSQNRSHAPKSAGAALRRYNEAALVKVRAFLFFLLNL